MLATKRYSIAVILGSTALLTLVGCGGGNSGGDGPAPPVNPLSLNGIVVGMADNSVPAGTNVPVTMMKQMRDLFDRIKNAPDFTKLSYDLGDGTPIFVLSTTTGDKFLPGKLALGLSYVLIDMKAKNDPMLADYLKEYRRITEAIINPLNPNGSYLYFNTSWGEYYYLLALNNLNANGLLSEAVSDATMASLKKRLTFCDVFGPDGTGSFDTCPLPGTPIDMDSLNNAQNYYAVAFGIAGLRQKLGWDNPAFSSKTDPTIATLPARDALLQKLLTHYRNDSSGGFSDEASNKPANSLKYYDQARFDRYSVLLIGETTERIFEMGIQTTLTPEIKTYIRKSVDLIWPQLNAEGKGFNYGRSIGPYGDTSFMEILTAAANAGVLSPEEKDVAYAYITQAARRYATFWYDTTLPTPSVNMWVQGRGTDTYRGKPRALGENFSLLHQYIYVNNWWTKTLGYANKTPMPAADVQAFLDTKVPKLKVTWYNLPSDAAHPYNAALITVRDNKRVINFNLSQAPDYNSFTPYYPVPSSDNLIFGTTDQAYPLLVPQITYAGKKYMPVTYYTNLDVKDLGGGKVTVTYSTPTVRQVAKNALAADDLAIQVDTVVTFERGSIRRMDSISSATISGNASVETDFASFAKLADSKVTGGGSAVDYANTDATNYQATGFAKCVLSDFTAVAGAGLDASTGMPLLLSTTPIGQLNTNFACTSDAFALNANGRTFSWALKYKDLP